MIAVMNLQQNSGFAAICNLARLHSAALAVVRCLADTFVYCVETVKRRATVTTECE